MRGAKWSEVLGLLFALLLALPLVMIVRSIMDLGPARELQGGRRISPVLDVEERTRPETYRRDCEQSLFGRQGASEITRAEMEGGAGTILAEMLTDCGNSNPKILKSE